MYKPSLFLRIFDYYGREFNLNVQGHQTYKTVFGSIVGLFSIISIMAISIYFVVDIFQRKNVLVIQNYDETLIPRNDLSKTPILFTFTDKYAKMINPEGIYSLEVEFTQYFNIALGTSNKTNIVLNTTKIPFQICQTSDFGDYGKYFQLINITNWFCITPGKYNLTLFGSFGDYLNGFSSLNILFTKCKNSNKNKCQNESIINNVISTSFFTISYASNYIDHYNYESPNQIKFESSTFNLSPVLTKRFYYNLLQNVYDTDYGFVFQNLNRIDFYKYDGYTLDVENGEGISLMQTPYSGYISIRNSSKVAYYYRSFTKFQTLLAYVGGVIKSILLLSGYLVSFVTNNTVLQKVSNLVFNFEVNDDENRENLNKGRVNKVLNAASNINLHDISIIRAPRLNINYNTNEFRLNCKEKLCRLVCLKSNKRLNKLANCESYINRRLSIDYIILSFFKLEKILKYFNLTSCNNIPYSIIDKDNENKQIEKKDAINMIDNSRSQLELVNRKTTPKDKSNKLNIN